MKRTYEEPFNIRLSTSQKEQLTQLKNHLGTTNTEVVRRALWMMAEKYLPQTPTNVVPIAKNIDSNFTSNEGDVLAALQKEAAHLAKCEANLEALLGGA